MTTFRLLPLLCSALILSGCVATWGDSKKIVRADEAGIVIHYDNAMFSSGGAKMLADQHCAKFGKKAEIVDAQMPGLLVGIIAEEYRCV